MHYWKNFKILAEKLSSVHQFSWEFSEYKENICFKHPWVARLPLNITFDVKIDMGKNLSNEKLP